MLGLGFEPPRQVGDAIEDSKDDGGKLKSVPRETHAARLKEEFGIVVEPITFNPGGSEGDILTNGDPTTVA